MPDDPFVHLHVASGYSLRYGASHPDVLAARAADHGMDALALTDRDGLYGAVKFVTACRSAGLRPLLGVDLAVEPDPDVAAGPTGQIRARRVPARGGAEVDPRHPRITLLARDGGGWASLARLVSATHLRGERGRPVTTRGLVADSASGTGGSGGLLVLLGPGSDVGRAVIARRLDLARDLLRRWREVLPSGDLVVEIVNHRGPDDAIRAARLLGLASEAGLPAVLSNAVRYADRTDAPTADVLDAARRLVALDLRHVDRVNAEGHLKSGKEMSAVADEVARLAGRGRGDARRLLAATRQVAERCAVDPRADLGMGEIHFPELTVLDSSSLGASSLGASSLGASSMGASSNAPERAGALLHARCEAGLGRRGMTASGAVRRRLDDELAMIDGLGYPAYFLTVADVVDLVRDMGVRVAARGSGAGSLVNYLLGISGVDPMRHGLIMERFLSPLRAQLPDVDIDVESARRTEIYEKVLERFGGERCVCVSMMDTYRVRHAIRDVGAALGLPPGEVDALAKAFPHIRARDARAALRELPELRASGIGSGPLDVLFRLVERLDGLPRHIALHPCGVLLSDTTLLDRTPVEASWMGFPMSQFDKDDVEELGLLKLDVLGIRMQSAMAHAVAEVARVDGVEVDLDDREQVPLDDPGTFELVSSTRTLGCFQIESPGQRELVGKFSPETFDDLIIDISLFRPGPVKSDMVTPFLEARHGWTSPQYLHPDLTDILEGTAGVVVFHEQVLEIVRVFTGVSLAEADEVRRGLGSRESQPEVKAWFFPQALARGYLHADVERVWAVLEAFASFGFCKAHAAAFALPTYQSAWLKAHHTAAFLAGVLTHDPGMYPKRLILDDARQFGITVLGLDVNASDAVYRVERVEPTAGEAEGALAYGIRLSLAEVKGISQAEVARAVAGRPYGSLSDFWHRARVTRPVVERLVVAGGFDSIYGIGSPVPVRRRGAITRRDLLLQIAELDRWTRSAARASRGGAGVRAARAARVQAAARPAEELTTRERPDAPPVTRPDVRVGAAGQSQAARAAPAVDEVPVQLSLLGPDVLGPGFLDPAGRPGSGLPEMTGAEQVRAELEVLGLDVSRHVIDFYAGFLDELGITWSSELLARRSQAELLVAGVKVATQTPPVRSGRRVVFVTLDDSTGPVDATFFEDAQGPYAATVFHSWLLVIRGVLRRTGRRGVSLRATGAWELPALFGAWETGGLPAVDELMAATAPVSERAVQGAAESRSSRPVIARPPSDGPRAGGMGGGRSRVLVHPSGFRQSPYADIKPAGGDAKSAPRKLWHSSPGSSGA